MRAGVSSLFSAMRDAGSGMGSHGDPSFEWAQLLVQIALRIAQPVSRIGRNPIEISAELYCVLA
jgi:hypothetical protein